MGAGGGGRQRDGARGGERKRATDRNKTDRLIETERD